MRESKQHPHAATARIGPTADKVRAMREDLGLTQQQAADVVHVDARTWRKWELAEREMHPAFFELFRIKTGA